MTVEWGVQPREPFRSRFDREGRNLDRYARRASWWDRAFLLALGVVIGIVLGIFAASEVIGPYQPLHDAVDIVPVEPVR